MPTQYDHDKDIGYHVEFHDSTGKKQSKCSAPTSTQVSPEAAESLARKMGYDTFEMYTTTTEVKRFSVDQEENNE